VTYAYNSRYMIMYLEIAWLTSHFRRMEIQACKHHYSTKVGFIDPGLVNEKLLKSDPGVTEDYILKSLLRHQHKQCILLPYSYEYVLARQGVLLLYTGNSILVLICCGDIIFLQLSLDPPLHRTRKEQDIRLGLTKER